jgi:hypothetical protein
MWLRDAGAAPGGEVQVELEPEGPQRADLADDIAEVVDLLAAGIKQRPRS